MNNEKPNLDHVLQGGYFHRTLRQWHSTNTVLNASNFIFPLFVHENDECLEEIPSLPNIKRFGINKLKDYLEPIVQNGLKCVLLFGVIEDEKLKDENGSYADNEKSSVIRAIPLLKKWFPDLLVACDVCLCAYTSHGHCGIFNEKTAQTPPIDMCFNREKSIKRLAEVSLTFAKAGADIIAPSDMMDGRINAIKQILESNCLLNKVAVMSYSAKFASSFYGTKLFSILTLNEIFIS
jgi:porphobilinogen synthase